MSRKFVFNCTALLAFMLLVPCILPGDVVAGAVFGPARYERATGAPETEAGAFTVSTGLREALLAIRNGDDNGENRVSSGVVTLNGMEVAGPSDFDRQAEWIERTVALEPENELAVRIGGKPGSFIVLTIVAMQPAPTVAISASPDSIRAGESCILSWSSTDAESRSISPGIGDVATSGSLTASPLQTTTYVITAAGPGGSASADVTVAVVNNPPVANDDTAVMDEDTVIDVHVLANDADPDGHSLSIAGLTEVDGGEAAANPDGSVRYSPHPDFNGMGGVAYTVSDGYGGVASARAVIAVRPVNDAPVADDQNIGVQEDTSASINLHGSDIDGDPLEFILVTPPNQGVLSGAAPALVYTPSPEYYGADNFTFKVSDGFVESAPATVSITVHAVNDPPAAVDDVAEAVEGSAVSINVVANDVDVDGDVLRIESVSQPANGVAVKETDSTVLYTSNPGFHGIDTFSYTVGDGNGGFDSALVTVTVEPTSPISLQILSPAHNDLIVGNWVLVEGTVSHVENAETGVTVNGRIALADGGRFAASQIELEEGENTITATATDAQGNTVTDTVTVFAQRTADYVKLAPLTESGASPLETTLLVAGTFAISEPILTWSGPGVVESIGGDGNEEHIFRIAGEGIYHFAVQAVDSRGGTHEDAVAILVVDELELDAMLRSKWGAMKEALGNRDIPGALTYFAGDAQELYNDIYTLISDSLPQIVQEMQDIQLVRVEDGMAEYRILRQETFDQRLYDISYHVYFVQDVDGLWKIYKY